MLPKQQKFNQNTLDDENQKSLAQVSLDADQLALLQRLTTNFSPLQLAWSSGYLAAKSEQSGVSAIAPQALNQAKLASTLTILYASQTGNAKGVATKLAATATEAGISVNLKNVADYKAKGLKAESHLLIVTSTNGEGEAPDDALSFHEFLLSKKAPKLPNLNYSVLALGDSSYEFFCQTGKDFDERLKALGAKQVAPRVDCDLDYQQQASAWTTSIIENLKDQLIAVNNLADVVTLPVSAGVTASQYDKENPYLAELSVSQKITGRDSNKDVRHIEIDFGDSGLTYQVGDALGVYFENDGALVAELIASLGLSMDEQVTVNNKNFTLTQALTNELEITQTAPSFVEFWAQASGDKTLLAIVADKNALREFANSHQVIDVVASAPVQAEQINAQQFVEALRHITPRLYSIASSQSEVEDEVHLTLALVEYQQGDKTRAGGASSFLGKRLEQGGKVKVFVEHNNNFRLPEKVETPVIMIGPGTGVAPFRAFMQEREALSDNGAELGNSWLFFGEQTFTQDFLYQVEWQNYLKSGLLSKLDVAFSRDQAEKIYVQDRLQENAAEVYQWLEQGAHLYICGDANRMAKDVHQTLIDIVVEQGAKTVEQAENYLKNLRINKRYQKDVY